MNSFIRQVVFFLVLTLMNIAQAMSVDWEGSYRLEYVSVDQPNLSSTVSRGTKSYFLNHLSLNPKIIATDGLNIFANIEMFPNTAYPGSQLGSDFGNSHPVTSYSGGNTQGSSSVEVNQLYMNWNHEYGAMVAGRAPIQFGLGMTHNAGNGLYDHWNETRDLVGYKFLIGNLSIMPSLGRTVRKNNFSSAGVATEQMWNIDYTNPETESTFAIYHQIKTSGTSANDGDQYFKPYFATASVIGGWNTSHTNVFIARGWEKFKFKMEAGFQSGGTGVNNGAGQEIKLSGYGVLVQLEFPRPESKWQYDFKFGTASGDVKSSVDQFEGYYFSKNYDVAFLMFNHPMGNATADVLRTQLVRQRTGAAGTIFTNDGAADEDTISNAMFFAPSFSYLMNDRWSWNNRIVYATAQAAPDAGVSTDLGFEYDTSFSYKPQENVSVSAELGFFVPGNAYKWGVTPATTYDANMNFGFQTKAAISF